MSYEQAMGQPVNPTSDLYASAIVLYEMLTARVPFSSKTNDFTEVVRQHQRALPLPPVNLNASIPPHINAAILRALEKESRCRFPTASEFAEALGCPVGQPIPHELAALAARMTPTVRVDEGQGNAEELPTRFIPSDSQTTRRPSLKVRSGGRQGTYINLKSSQVIGRPDIDPSDLTISRQHFHVEYNNSTCLIIDKDSASGTFVNGVRLAQGTSRPLVPGDTIQVGQTILVYEAPI
jgi:serine/threonine protein kinase